MRLEDITAEVRPRSRWEAVDLGLALTRRHFPRLLATWLLCVGPVWALVIAAMPWIGTFFTLLLLWWWKPLFDRVPLFILSRALFGPPPTLGETLRAWPRLMFRALPYALLTGRFSGARSLLLPVTLLEGLRGVERRERCNVLLRHSGARAGSLTTVCALYEGMLTIGLALLIEMFNPDEGSLQWIDALIESGFTRGIPPSLLGIAIGCWLGAMMLTELFYVGAGFGLYLNARTHLEGWDVELAFRRLGRRLQGIGAAMLVALLFLTSTTQAIDPIAAEKAEIAREMDTVIQSDDFKIHKVTSWQPELKTKAQGGEPPIALLKMLGYIMLSSAAAFALWWLVRFILRHWHTLRGEKVAQKEAQAPAARVIAGLDVTPESLPRDILAAARDLSQRGDTRGALSLLYRGALSHLVHELHVPVRTSDTEGDCLRRTANVPEAAFREYFTRLTSLWVGAAYARRAPQTTEMESLLASWPFLRQLPKGSPP